MKDIILELLKHKNTRWALTILVLIAALMLPNIKSCSGMGFTFQFDEVSEEVNKSDSITYEDIILKPNKTLEK